MTKRNKKVSNLQANEFYCYKCNEYMEKNMRHSKVSKHCAKCQIKIVKANKVKKENVIAAPKQVTVDARELRQRMEEIRFNREIEQANGNHLEYYL